MLLLSGPRFKSTKSVVATLLSAALGWIGCSPGQPEIVLLSQTPPTSIEAVLDASTEAPPLVFVTQPADVSAETTACKNLQCKQVACADGKTTSVSGTVFDPSGRLPLYNVVVYVPNAPLAPIQRGVTCDRCGTSVSGEPLATALTDTKGQFVLNNVPVGQDIPLVMQIGKWRRQVTIPSVTACTDNALTNRHLTRLARNQTEGDIPRIAITTGGADALECVIRKLGVEATEFTPESGPGRINLYEGVRGANRYEDTMNSGASFTPAHQFWNDLNKLMQYDVVVLSCEGAQHPETKSAAALRAIYDYANAGGRILASHWHNYWFEAGPDPFPSVATFHHQKTIGDLRADIDMTFPKGQAFAAWLFNVDASDETGKIDIVNAKHTVDAVNPKLAQQWVYSAKAKSVQHLTANTPMTATPEAQCGRVALTDMHVSEDESSPDTVFPTGCDDGDMTPQEKAFAFMIFDLSACVVPDSTSPTAPVPAVVR